MNTGDLWNKQIRVLIIILLSNLLGSCGFSAGAENSHSTVEARTSPDFVLGEVVTTSSGYQGIGVFGEVSEKKNTPNFYQFEGVFYE